MTPTCVELFAGGGGASCGLRTAGFKSVCHVEWEPDACATLRAAGFDDVHEGDVREVAFAGLGPVQLLWASPPCQAFSTSGKRLGAADDRNGWPWTLDAIDRLRLAGSGPEWVICENVPGLLQHVDGCDQSGEPGACSGCYWERHIIPEFRSRFTHVDWRVLDAADYGVPQRRRRVILVAGPKPFPWPAPTHTYANLLYDKWVGRGYWARHGLAYPTRGPSSAEGREMGVKVSLATAMPDTGKLPYATVRDVLGLKYPIRHQSPSALAVQHLPDEVAPSVSGKGTLYAEREVQEVGGYNPHYHEGFAHGWVRQDSTGNPAHSVDVPVASVTTSGMLYLYDENPGIRPQKHPDPAHRRGKQAEANEVLAARLTMTTAGVFDLFGDEPKVVAQVLGDDPVVEAKGRRRLTSEECALLQGFPSDYPWQGMSTSRYKQVGNAVPPPLAAALGRAVASL